MSLIAWRGRSTWPLASGDGSSQRKPTSNAEAYSLYLQGEDLFRQAEATNTNGRSAAELLQRPTALDPSFALGFAKLSLAHSRLIGMAEIAPQRVLG